MQTGILIRAAIEGKEQSVDIADKLLSSQQVVHWLRSRGNSNPYAENVVLALLGKEQLPAEPAPPNGATCHYEHDEQGNWYVTWSGDFIGDPSSSRLIEHSTDMQIAYQMGIVDGDEAKREEVLDLLRGGYSVESLQEYLTT